MRKTVSGNTRNIAVEEMEYNEEFSIVDNNSLDDINPTDEELDEIFEEEKVTDFEDADMDYEAVSYDYRDMIKNARLLTSEDEVRLSNIIKGGGPNAKRAKEEFEKANIRLVVAVARKYMEKLNYGMELDDLITMGYFGLAKAVVKFDASKGYRFSTYATWWIKQAITRGLIEEEDAIKTPSHMREKQNKIYKFTKNFSKDNGRAPSYEEIASELGMKPKKVKEIMLSHRQVVSLDAPIGEEDDCDMYETVEDTSVILPLDKVLADARREALNEAMSILTEKEALVIKLRYGFYGEPKTLDEIAKREEFNVTRERIRQIEDKALRKIRRSFVTMENLRAFAS